MLHLEWIAQDRIAKFKEQLEKVKCSEFVEESTKLALERIDDEINELNARLVEANTLSNKQFIVNQVISINQKIFSLTNYLGILLRSTNLRNCFEGFYALNLIVRQLFGDENKLIVSSEWDSIPFYIPAPPKALSSFVIIGIPAFESRNALLLPLASHEIGHAIWRIKGLDSQLIKTATDGLEHLINSNPERFLNDFSIENDLFQSDQAEDVKSKCLEMIMAQCQEMFCDLFGANLFKESYVYAYDAFLAPGFGTREASYPSFARRAQYIVQAALSDPSSLREGVLAQSDLMKTESPRAKNNSLIRYSDPVVQTMEKRVGELAIEFVESLQPREGENAQDIMRNLRNRIPPNNPRSVVDILNAVWRVYFEKFDSLKRKEDVGKLFHLMNNLCLKSLEIFEFRVRGLRN